ncbi:MAG: HAD-IA family hydrolase [Clostridiales bacterium]|jgi:phosphoglycolate phosphatase|nr:HAD-IA family hydrolase [Clostridiales bacterium]
MDYKAYVFDYDYTLAFSERAILMCFYHIFDKFGYKGISEQEIVLTIGMALTDAIAKLSGEYDPKRLAQLVDEFHRKADEVMTPYTVLYPPVEPLLRKIIAEGGLAGIVSNKRRERISDMIATSGLNDLIGVIIGPEDFKNFKPDPEGLILAMKRLNVSKQDTVYIGDNMIDALTAKNAGVDFIAVLTGRTTEKEFSAQPHRRIIRDLSALLD